MESALQIRRGPRPDGGQQHSGDGCQSAPENGGGAVLRSGRIAVVWGIQGAQPLVSLAGVIDGARRGTTPFSLDLNNHTSHTVVFRQAGHQEVTCQLTTSVGAGWVILDVLVGLVPVIVDAATGKWNSLDQGVCNVVLPAARGANWEEDKKSYQDPVVTLPASNGLRK